MQQLKEAFNYDSGLDELIKIYGDQVQTSNAVCEQYGKDESFHPSMPPHAVIQPENTEQVQQIVQICSQYNIPIIPHGAGTSLEGNISAVKGGICIDSGRMNQIVQLNAEDFDVVVQPGITRRQLNDQLKGTGLFFPIDPGADASIGGMAATRASGTNAVRYGSMRENVINIEAVMADGSVIRTAKRSRKSAAGYDLTRLLVGSEGTLGIFTELTIKLYPIPECMSAAVCTFESIEGAVDTVIQMIQYGIPVARVELLDDLSMKAINIYSKMDFSEVPTLFFEFHGSESGVEEQATLTQDIASENGGSEFQWTTNTEERSKMWRARHDVAYASKLLHPKGEIWATDVCVPISRLADCMNQTREDINQSEILAPIVGHVGDGNFHLVILVDHDNEEEVKAAEALHERMIIRALEMGGTCTGEHGIGLGKLDYLKKEHGNAVESMWLIKQALDPKNIFNPGKILDGI